MAPWPRCMSLKPDTTSPSLTQPTKIKIYQIIITQPTEFDIHQSKDKLNHVEKKVIHKIETWNAIKNTNCDPLHTHEEITCHASNSGPQ